MRLQNQAQGVRRGRSSNSTQAAFALTSGRKSVTWTSGVATVSDGTLNHPITLMGRFRGVNIGFGGVGTNNQTANFRLYVVRFGVARTAELPNPDFTACLDAQIVPYIADTSTITLGSGTGVTGGVYSASELIADTITATLATTATTPPGIGSTLETARALGTMQVYSPGDDKAARLIIPDLGGFHGFIVEFDMTGATSMDYDYDLSL